EPPLDDVPIRHQVITVRIPRCDMPRKPQMRSRHVRNRIRSGVLGRVSVSQAQIGVSPKTVGFCKRESYWSQEFDFRGGFRPARWQLYAADRDQVRAVRQLLENCAIGLVETHR